MIPILAEFLDLLARQPNTEVPSVREVDGVVWAEVIRGDVRATLVANAALPPVTAEVRPEYGAYSIHRDGYADWIKGDDPAECVAHVLGWFDGLAARVPGPLRRADLRSLTEGSNERPEVDAVMVEIAMRSALRVTGAGHMTSLDRRHMVLVQADGAAVQVLAGSGSYAVITDMVGVCAAAILGFIDGYSLESDD